MLETDIPEDPQLADTYYSQYDDFESSEGEDSDDAEDEIAEKIESSHDRHGVGKASNHRDDYGQLIHHMQNALDLDSSSEYQFSWGRLVSEIILLSAFITCKRLSIVQNCSISKKTHPNCFPIVFDLDKGFINVLVVHFIKDACI